MILEQINKKPFIHLGFNRTEITAQLNEVVSVWVDTFSNLDIDGAVKVNDNHFTILCDKPGSYYFKSKGTIESNEIKITVI